MNIDRRRFLGFGAAALAAPALLAQPRPVPLRAIAFDGLVVFDTRRVLALAEASFPGRGNELVNAWRARQFEYQWLRLGGERYADFLRVTRDSLEFAARSLGLALTAESRTAFMQVYLELEAWPDARPALLALAEAGLRLAFLSNMTTEMLDNGIERAGLRGLFDRVLSTDRVKSFKPAPRAYALAPDALGLPTESILFVASAGWDATGSKWFGFPTYWVNRGAAPREELDGEPDGIGRDLNDLVEFVRGRTGPA
jgi:2-haloacid dehalogenase